MRVSGGGGYGGDDEAEKLRAQFAGDRDDMQAEIDMLKSELLDKDGANALLEVQMKNLTKVCVRTNNP